MGPDTDQTQDRIEDLEELAREMQGEADRLFLGGELLSRVCAIDDEAMHYRGRAQALRQQLDQEEER